MANNWSHWGNGHLVWIAAVSEWCEIVSFVSTSSWSYFRPSTATVTAGGFDLTTLKPDFHRPLSLADKPPKLT